MFSKELTKYLSLPEKLSKKKCLTDNEYSCKEKPIFYLILKTASKSFGRKYGVYRPC